MKDMDLKSSLLLSKILESTPYRLDNISKYVASGIGTGGNKIFCIPTSQAMDLQIEEHILKPVLAGRDIHEFYVPKDTGNTILYTTKATNSDNAPNAIRYLSEFKEKLSGKRETKKGLIPYWSLHWPRTTDLFENQKIVIRQTSDTVIAAKDESGFYCVDSVLIIQLNNSNIYSYIIALLNSKLMRWVYTGLTQEKKRVFAQVKPVNLRKLPIILLDENSGRGEEILSRLNYLAGEIEALQIEIQADNIIEKQEIEKYKSELNELIYEIYGLDDEEVRLIEDFN